MHLAILKKPAREQSAIEMVTLRRSRRSGGYMMSPARAAAAQNMKRSRWRSP